MTETLVLRWVLGLLGVSLLMGHIVTRLFVSVLNRALDTQDVDVPWAGVPAWLRKTTVGLVERTFFTVVIGVGLSGTAIALVAWTGINGALYWGTFGREHRAQVLVGVLGTLISLLWAVIGAVVCAGPLSSR